jgi:hypothetical protein
MAVVMSTSSMAETTTDKPMAHSVTSRPAEPMALSVLDGQGRGACSDRRG